MNDIAQHTMDTIFYHKQRYSKLKHESLAKDDVITRLKQDIVDLQDKLSDQNAERVYYQDQLSELTGNIVE